MSRIRISNIVPMLAVATLLLLVIDIFRDAGFERIATSYTMKKSLL